MKSFKNIRPENTLLHTNLSEGTHQLNHEKEHKHELCMPSMFNVQQL